MRSLRLHLHDQYYTIYIIFIIHYNPIIRPSPLLGSVSSLHEELHPVKHDISRTVSSGDVLKARFKIGLALLAVRKFTIL
jgi:hypothetical protein